MGDKRISVRCSYNEHAHCGGQVKFGNADGTDDCYQCDCPCHMTHPASPASGAAPQPLSDDRLREILNDWCEDKDYSLADVRRDLALAAPAPGKREVEWVIVAEGEGAEVRLVFDADPHEEIHCFMCVCGKPWRECTTDGMREDVARFDDPDEWGFDEAGKPYSVAWRHETGTVKVFRVRAALEAAAAEEQTP